MNPMMKISRIQISPIFYSFGPYFFEFERPFFSQLKRFRKFPYPFAIMDLLVHVWVFAIFCLRNRG
jgi:hypothetical protein